MWYCAPQLHLLYLAKGEAGFYKPIDGTKTLACKYKALPYKNGSKIKVMFMLSTTHFPGMVDTGKKGRGGNTVYKPSVIKNYYVHIGGINRAYQQLHSFHFLRRSYKWYTKLDFRHNPLNPGHFEHNLLYPWLRKYYDIY